MAAEVAKVKIPSLSGGLEQGKLVNKLKKVFDDLRKIGDGKASVYENSDLARFTTELARPDLVKHQDVSVQWLLAACSLQIFRVFYPEVPYSDPSMIKSVLDLYLRRLKAPPSPGSQQFWYYYNILEVAASIKVFSLCHNYGFDQIGKQVIMTCIKTVSVVKNKPKAISSMVKIIEQYLSCAETISRELLDLVLMPLLDKVKEPAAYELCKELWMAASGDLEPFLQSLYSSSLGGGIGTDEEKEPCLAIQHINDIILELHRIAPTVLNTILPQMEYRLKVEEEEVRCETAQLLGRMFAEQSSLLAQENKALWQSFCGRFQDVSGKVRSECVRVSQFLLVYHPEMRKATTEKLELCLLDGLDEIRLLTVQSVLAAAKENIDSVSKQLLSNAAERIRDKKFVVRQAAVRGLARLYNHILRSNGESINEPVQHVLWIPLKIFNCYYLQSIQDRLLVEQSLHMQLLPSWVEGEDGRQMTDDKHRTKRLLIMYCSLDDSARRAFREVLRIQSQVCGYFRTVLEKYGEADEEQEEKDQSIKSLTTKLAACLEEPLKAKEHLSQLWTKLNDKKLMQCLKTATSRDSKCSEVTQAVFETLHKLGEKNPLRRTIDSLFYRSCLRLVDGNIVQLLLNKLKQLLKKDEASVDETAEDDEQARKEDRGADDVPSATVLVQVLGEMCPWHFATSDAIHALLVLANEKDELVVTTALQILTAVGKEKLTKTLRGLAGTVSNVVNTLALEGSPREAKCGLRAVISTCSDVKRFFTKLYKKLSDQLSCDDQCILTLLMSLRFVAEKMPDLVLDKKKEVVHEFIGKLLATDKGRGTRGSGWCEKHDLSLETKVKMSCMKVLVHFLEGLDTRDDPRTAKKFFEKMVDMLGTTIERRGDVNDTGKPSLADRAWLRSTAASCLMHLACGSSAYRQNLDPYPIFGCFTMIGLDERIEVRRRFLYKLNGFLMRKRVKPHYMAFFCFSAFETNKELKSQAKNMLMKQVHSWRDYAQLQCRSVDNAVLLLPEYVVPTVVYLLAHHEEYGEDDKSLYRIRDYLWFFLEAVTNRSDNLGFIKSLLEMIKCTHDATVHNGDEEQDEADRRLYIVAELAHMILSVKITNFRQFEFPGRAGLPPTLYRTKEGSGFVMQKVLPTSFIIYPKREPGGGELHASKTSRSGSVSQSSSGGRKRRHASSESYEKGEKSAKSSTIKQEKRVGSKRAASVRAARSLAESFEEIKDAKNLEYENGADVFDREYTEIDRIHSPSKKSMRSQPKPNENGMQKSPAKQPAPTVRSEEPDKQETEAEQSSISKRPVKRYSPKKKLSLKVTAAKKPFLKQESPKKDSSKKASPKRAPAKKVSPKKVASEIEDLEEIETSTKLLETVAGGKTKYADRGKTSRVSKTKQFVATKAVDKGKKTSSPRQSRKKSLPVSDRKAVVAEEEALNTLYDSDINLGVPSSPLATSLTDSPPKYQKRKRQQNDVAEDENTDSPSSPVKFRKKRKIPLDASSDSPVKVKKTEKSVTVPSLPKPKGTAKGHRQRQLEWGGRLTRSRAAVQTS